MIATTCDLCGGFDDECQCDVVSTFQVLLTVRVTVEATARTALEVALRANGDRLVRPVNWELLDWEGEDLAP